MMLIVAGLLALWALAALVLDQHGRARPGEGRWDAVVVAGCRVDPDGQPSLALKRRTRLAVTLWREGLAPRVLFTGGLGTYAPSEARAAADYATRELGLDEGAALLEERSTSTEENAKNAAAILRERDLPAQRILLVTDGYHTFRAGRVFRRYFPEVRAVGSTPSPSVRVRGALREVGAVGWYLLAGRL